MLLFDSQTLLINFPYCRYVYGGKQADGSQTNDLYQLSLTMNMGSTLTGSMLPSGSAVPTVLLCFILFLVLIVVVMQCATFKAIAKKAGGARFDNEDI